MRNSARRGFSLIELALVIAIFAILAALSAPMLLGGKPQQRLREAASELVANIRLARSIAVSGQTVAGGPAEAVELWFDDAANSYSIVAINPAGLPVIMKTVKMSDYRGATLDLTPTIVPTPATPVRFQKNGAADRVATITITETTISQKKDVEITRAGLSRID